MNSDRPSPVLNGVIAVVLLGGALCLWWIWKQARSPQQQAMTTEELERTLRRGEARDRDNWEKMWKEAGKKPPAAPALESRGPH